MSNLIRQQALLESEEPTIHYRKTMCLALEDETQQLELLCRPEKLSCIEDIDLQQRLLAAFSHSNDLSFSYLRREQARLAKEAYLIEHYRREWERRVTSYDNMSLIMSDELRGTLNPECRDELDYGYCELFKAYDIKIMCECCYALLLERGITPDYPDYAKHLVAGQIDVEWFDEYEGYADMMVNRAEVQRRVESQRENGVSQEKLSEK